MTDPTPNGVPDYLVIGHLAKDLTPGGPVLGGTAAYAGLTARALGLRVGLVTSAGPELDLSPLSETEIRSVPSGESTCFENQTSERGRRQILHSLATPLGPEAVPTVWRSARLVHLAPISQEVSPRLIDFFPGALIALTPQGWLRAWDKEGVVRRGAWESQSQLLPLAGAVILSLEDLEGDEEAVEQIAGQCRLLAVTEASHGARVFAHGQVRRFEPPRVTLVDSTGAGDIFAASFLIRLFQTRDPWEAARFAVFLSARSVSRMGLDSVPTLEDIRAAWEPIAQ